MDRFVSLPVKPKPVDPTEIRGAAALAKLDALPPEPEQRPIKPKGDSPTGAVLALAEAALTQAIDQASKGCAVDTGDLARLSRIVRDLKGTPEEHEPDSAHDLSTLSDLELEIVGAGQRILSANEGRTAPNTEISPIGVVLLRLIQCHAIPEMRLPHIQGNVVPAATIRALHAALDGLGHQFKPYVSTWQAPARSSSASPSTR